MKLFEKNAMRIIICSVLLIAIVAIGVLWHFNSSRSKGEEIGSINTHFQLGGSDGLVTSAFDDPKIDGVTCFVTRARTGGVKGKLGLAEDKTEASIACAQTKAHIVVKDSLAQQEELFQERMSVGTKSFHAVRMVDFKRNTLLYVTYSDKVADGSPKNSMSVIAVSQTTPLQVH